LKRFLSVPLGSIPELPAETCSGIKTSEGNEITNSKYWIFSDGNAGEAILARCEGYGVLSFTSRILGLNPNYTQIFRLR